MSAKQIDIGAKLKQWKVFHPEFQELYDESLEAEIERFKEAVDPTSKQYYARLVNCKRSIIPIFQ